MKVASHEETRHVGAKMSTFVIFYRYISFSEIAYVWALWQNSPFLARFSVQLHTVIMYTNLRLPFLEESQYDSGACINMCGTVRKSFPFFSKTNDTTRVKGISFRPTQGVRFRLDFTFISIHSAHAIWNGTRVHNLIREEPALAKQNGGLTKQRSKAKITLIFMNLNPLMGKSIFYILFS